MCPLQDMDKKLFEKVNEIYREKFSPLYDQGLFYHISDSLGLIAGCSDGLIYLSTKNAPQSRWG